MMPKKVIGEYDKRSAPFGFGEWELNAKDKAQELLNRFIEEAFAEALAIATKEYECHAWLPKEWSKGDGIDDTDVDDPTTIYVELPLGANEVESPRWKFRLGDLVNSVIELHEMGEGGPIDEPDRPILISIRDSLRSLADRLDSALSR